MKKIIFYCTACLFFLLSCNEESINLDLSETDDLVLSRAITPEVSSIFDWEDMSSIELLGVRGNVTLPWYSGATSSIPNYVTESYSAADGWKMIYNFCTTPNNVQEGRYYLVFYNIFTGTLRTFVYNNYDVTNSNVTFWKVSFNQKTTMLNALEEYTLPLDKISEETEILVTNASRTPTKALSRGWNSFDIDNLCYNRNAANERIFMNIDLYDIAKSDLDISGNIDLSSEGTIVTIKNSTKDIGIGKTLKQVSSFAGKAAKKYLEAKYQLSEGVVNGVESIMNKGLNLIVDKVVGKKNVQDILYSDLKIETEGTLKLNGDIKQVHQSNILPISRLVLPGTRFAPEDSFLPSYEGSLGVWNLESTPELCFSKTLTSFLLFDKHDMKGVPRNSQELPVYRRQIYQRKLDTSTVHIIINPAVLSEIDHYTVEIELVNRRINIKDAERLNLFYWGEKIMIVDNRTIQKGNSDCSFNYIMGRTGDKVNIDRDWFDFEFERIQLWDYYDNLPYDYMSMYPHYPAYVTDRRIIKDGEFASSYDGRIVKDLWLNVTVTLYPKSSYNQKPYVSSRNYQVISQSRVID